MAHYTITIKSLLDNDFDFGLSSYPIFDENYRNILNQKILYHYYENEIGFETTNLFKFYLNNKMNEIMPYYNELYLAQKYLIDNNLLFKNVNITENSSGSDTKHDTNATTNNTSTSTQSNSTSQNSGQSNNKNLFQDTPQGTISQTDIDAQTWATNLTLDKNTSNNTITDASTGSGTSNNTINSNFNSNGTNQYLKTIIGNTGGKFNIDLLNDIKEKLMNIDLMIINDLNDLFMGIF